MPSKFKNKNLVRGKKKNSKRTTHPEDSRKKIINNVGLEKQASINISTTPNRIKISYIIIISKTKNKENYYEN